MYFKASVAEHPPRAREAPPGDLLPDPLRKTPDPCPGRRGRPCLGPAVRCPSPSFCLLERRRAVTDSLKQTVDLSGSAMADGLDVRGSPGGGGLGTRLACVLNMH